MILCKFSSRWLEKPTLSGVDWVAAAEGRAFFCDMLGNAAKSTATKIPQANRQFFKVSVLSRATTRDGILLYQRSRIRDWAESSHLRGTKSPFFAYLQVR